LLDWYQYDQPLKYQFRSNGTLGNVGRHEKKFEIYRKT
jgi:hypothetical protein